MKLCFTELMIELSHALDYVEKELIGVQTHHGKRVAYLCSLLGRYAGLTNKECLDLAACAVLHDNALSEYLQLEYLSTGEMVMEIEPNKIGIHCTIGERNIQGFPFWGDVKNVILYHHENADGSGPFAKMEGEIPFYASLIHLADQVDARFSLRQMNEEKWEKIRNYVMDNTGKLFAHREASLFLEHMNREEMSSLSDDNVDKALHKVLAYVEEDYSPEDVMHISGIFARIVDYKSTFTSLHSMGIAHKAYTMASYYHLSKEMSAKLFLAGALHDIGKLAVDVNILEKMDKLTMEEFDQIKKHALITYEILHRIHGMEDICRWAALHHEKLNGNGYPFGFDGSKLGKYERLIGCLDIYQALREDRPYKKGKSHEETMEILRQMAKNGFVDALITEDIHKVFRKNLDHQPQAV